MRRLCALALGAQIVWAASAWAAPPSVAPSITDRLASGGDAPAMVVVAAHELWTGTLSALWRNDTRALLHVRLRAPLAVARTEVTVGQFRAFITASGWRVESGCWHHGDDQVWRFEPARSWDAPGFPQDDTHPVTCVSWYDARAYVRWLSRETGFDYRLPSESEFEAYAAAPHEAREARAAAVCAQANGADTSSPLSYHNPACSDGQRYTAPVASYAANGWGLYDARGNVWEWSEDCSITGIRGWWYALFSASDDGAAWHAKDCDVRVSRGGSWISSAANLAPSARWRSPPGYRMTTVGIRPVRSLTPTVP